MPIRVQRATKETRTRDIKRRRFVLTVGTHTFHMTMKELVALHVRVFSLILHEASK